MIAPFLALALAPLPAAPLPAPAQPEVIARQAVDQQAPVNPASDPAADPTPTAVPAPETAPQSAGPPVADAPADASLADAGAVPPVPDAPGTDPAVTDVAATDPALDETIGPDIVVTASEKVPGDPIADINIQTFAVTQAVDDAIIAPIARTYEHNVPLPVRQGLHNFLNNLDEPIVFANFLLQLKPGKALRTAGRFAINTVLGIGGLIDVAKKKPFNLPRRSNGLADTLGYYGVGPGPYLYLPVIGATTVRDLAARPFDLLMLPAILPAPFKDPTVALAKGSLNALDERVNFDEDLRRLREDSESPYAAVRDYYLARRQAEIDHLRGRGPTVENPDFEWQVKPARKTPPDPQATPASEDAQ